MKEIVIITVCIIMVIIGANISMGYLSKTGNDLIANLDELKVEIEKAQNGQENKSQELANNIYNKWQDLEDKWSIIVVHNELDLIELSLISMKTCIDENEYLKSIEELEKSSFLLEHIQSKEKLDIKNVF